MKLRKNKKKRIGNVLSKGIILVIVSFVMSLIIINYFSNRFRMVLLPIAESQIRKVVTKIINSACDEYLVDDNLYEIKKNDDNEIEMISYNSFLVTKLINEVTSKMENDLRDIELGKVNYYDENGEMNGGVILEIPFGVIFGNSLIGNIGPRLKLRFSLLGDVLSNVETEVKPYGINNAYVEMRISLEVTARIILPFVSEKVTISNVIPISMNVVSGTVPQGYIMSYK